jgi:hypothetical protein
MEACSIPTDQSMNESVSQSVEAAMSRRARGTGSGSGRERTYALFSPFLVTSSDNMTTNKTKLAFIQLNSARLALFVVL